jgi:hypothetical protein
MVITAAQITPRVALIAGVLILVMPRLLNLVIATRRVCARRTSECGNDPESVHLQ